MKVARNEGYRLRLRKLGDWEARMKFQTELKKLFEKASSCLMEYVEEVWKEFKWAILAVTERVVGRQKLSKHRKATSWWNNDVKEAVKRNKYFELNNSWGTEAPLNSNYLLAISPCIFSNIR